MASYRLPADYGTASGKRGWIWVLVTALVLLSATGGGAYWLLSQGAFASLLGPKGDTLDEGWLSDVAARGDTLVAVGDDYSDQRTPLMILTSTDSGRTWKRAHITDARGALTSGERVLATKDGWLVMATEYGEPPTLLTSKNGHEWRPLLPSHASDNAFTDGDHLADIARGPSGFLLAGTHHSESGAMTPVLWTSPDGEHWRRHSEPGLGILDGAQSGTVDGIAIYGQTIMLSGWVDSDRGTGQWRSTDGGRTWKAVGPASSDVTLLTEPIVHPNRGFVALGTNGGVYQLLASRDGKHWSDVAVLPAFPSESQTSGTAMSMAASHGGYAALVQDQDEALAFMRSNRGRPWRTGGEESVFELSGGASAMPAIAVTDSTVVGVANVRTGDSTAAQIYVATKGKAPKPANLPEPG